MKSVVFRAQFTWSLLFWTFLITGSALSAFAQGSIVLTNRITLVPAGSVWKFTEGTAPANTWKDLGYDDSSWRSGPAQLGYGDGDEATVTRTNGAPHPITTLFRHRLVVDGPVSTNLTLRLLRDDGAVVYLNGTEILRDNMPAGPITDSTTASSTAGPGEENDFRSFFITASITPGTNVLAVEVHQVSTVSSDLSFDLSLSASRPTNLPVVSIRATQPNTSEPLPNALVAPGQFVITREDSATEAPLHVRLSYSGSAGTNDYEPLPATVIIPAGSNSVQILVLPKSDDLVEGTEVVVARIVPPLSLDLPSLVAERPYWIDPERASAEVRIADEDTNSVVLPLVSIEATRPGTSEPLSNAVLVLPGEFTVTRVDLRLDLPLTVGLRYSGTAVPSDYEGLPQAVTIAPGMSSTSIWVRATSDDLVEDTEVVRASIVATADMAVMPPRDYRVDRENGSAEVSILDEDTNIVARPLVSLITVVPETKEPRATEDVRPGQFRIKRTGGNLRQELFVYLRYTGTASSLQDYAALPSPVRFESGVTEVNLFVEAKDDEQLEQTETVIAELLVLETAQGIIPPYLIDPAANSGTVRILDNDSPSVATLRITNPVNGSVLPQGPPIEVSAVAIDLAGYIPRVEFYANNALIGVSEIAFLVPPEPGTPITHTIVWSNAPAGQHVLTARAKDSRQYAVVSPEIRITVGFSIEIPTVSVRFIPHETDEVWPDADFAPGSFEFRRTGLSNTTLTAYYRVTGTATPAVDYERLSGVITFDPGLIATRLKVEAIDDRLLEGNETVIVSLREALVASFVPTPGYQVDPTNHTATLIIVDNERTNGVARIEITEPDDGDAFRVGTPIPVEAVAVDPNGYISRLDFYADNNLIGISEIVFVQAPAPGTPIEHSITWSNAPAGRHVLTARGTNSSGERVVSAPVHILVGTNGTPGQVVVEVETVDGEAAEIEEDGTTDRAVFAIRRVAGPSNVEVDVRFSMSGTAENGIDYERLSGVAHLRAGQMRADVTIRPIPDKALEGEETVILTLEAAACPEIFPVPPGCYRIGTNGAARAVIRDGTGGTNLPPRVSIVRPRDGAVFELGQSVDIHAHASDRDGKVAKLDLFVNDLLVWTTNHHQLRYRWTNTSTGRFTLRARATDNSGTQGESEPVRILVREAANNPFVRRELPAGYIPGVPFRVQLIANPPDDTSAWAVEDQPPRGWTVSSISDDGVYDAANGKVKFGHYSGDRSRTLSYHVTPPPGVSGPFEFNGTASADGRSYPISGDRVISGVALDEHHPADDNQDNRITLVELTGYALEWKDGLKHQRPTNNVPLSYLTRAALIWRQGEVYHFVSTNPPPQCWVPNAATVRSLALIERSAIRSGAASASPGAPTVVTITVDPAGSAFALEETVPQGWIVTDVSDDGTHEPGSGAIRWGLFMDGAARELRYTLAAPEGVTSVAELQGNVSFDGDEEPVGGASRLIAVEGSALLRLPHCERRADGAIQLKLTGAAGQVCLLESSSDLNAWTLVDEVFLPDGELDLVDDGAVGSPVRFYRLRVR